MRLRFSLMLALAMLVLCSTSAFAAPPPFSMTVEPGATPNSWVYTLYNDDMTGNVIPTGLDLVWDPPAPTSYYNITGTPAGWVINPSYDWPAWDALSNDPTAGESLKGFAFTAETYAPYFTAYYNVMGDDLWYDGDVTLVPEPSSILALFGGVGSLVAMIRRRRA